MEFLLVHKTIDGVHDKHSAEKDQFREQEEPHSHPGAVIVPVNVMNCGVRCGTH
jgi:hypothetical protein